MKTVAPDTSVSGQAAAASWTPAALVGIGLLLSLLASPLALCAAGREIHGENSVYAGDGVAVAWAVLKARDEDQSQVVMRIIRWAESSAVVRIEGVDPFTQSRRVIIEGEPLRDVLDVRSLRGSFADHPRREIHLYRTLDDWRTHSPTLTIFYHGVPDTSPEFTSEAALFRYLEDALSKAREKTP